MTRLLALLLVLPAFAQAQGRVAYTVVTALDVELPPEMEALRDQIPTETTARRELLFDDDAALTRNAEPSEAAGSTTPASGSGVRIQTLGGDGSTQAYLDRTTGALTTQRDLLGRTFRVLGEAPTLTWRLTGEQSEFLGYACQRAVADRNGTTVEAWFAPALPDDLGPSGYGGLPGLILVLRAGNVTFEATAVELGPLDPGVLAPPTEGEEVTREAFDAIQTERLRDLETMGAPGGGTVRILRG